MTFKQIREINKKFMGLKIETHLTSMFNNSQWGATWTIEFIEGQEMKELLKYLDKNNLNYFFCKVGIIIQ